MILVASPVDVSRGHLTLKMNSRRSLILHKCERDVKGPWPEVWFPRQTAEGHGGEKVG